MTFPSELKRLLILWWPEAFLKRRPMDYTVVIEDKMGSTKSKREDDRTCRQYMNSVLKPCVDAIKDLKRNITHYYMLLDRGFPIQKGIFAHPKRTKDSVKPMDEPDPKSWDPYVIPDEYDGQLPFDWDSFIANRDLTRRNLYWLFYRSVMDPIEGLRPGPGKFVMIHGAPHKRLTKAEAERDPDAFNRVYYCQGLQAPTAYNPSYGQDTVHRAECGEYYNDHVREADLATMFYAKQQVHRHQNILIDMNDGDIISIALAFAPERIDPMTGQFRNKMYLRLPGSGKAKKPSEKTSKKKKPGDDIDLSCDYYVDVNKLYKLIAKDSRFRGNGVQNPHLTLISLIIMCGTDFFGDYEHDDHGLFYQVGNVDHVIGTFMENADKYSHLFQLYYGNTWGQPDTIRKPVIDEKLFIDFVFDCYKSKYGELAEKKFGNMSRESLIKYCELTSKNIKRKERETDDKWQKRFVRGLKRLVREDDPSKSETEEDFQKRVADAKAPRKEEETDADFERRVFGCLKRHDAHVIYESEEAREKSDAEWAKRIKKMMRQEFESDESWDKRVKSARRKRIPPPNIILRYCRVLKIHLLYWYNEYREGAASVLDPLRKDDGVPHFGFEYDEEQGRYTLSKSVSRMNLDEIPEVYKRHFDELKPVDGKLPSSDKLKRMMEKRKRKADKKKEAEDEIKRRKVEEEEEQRRLDARPEHVKKAELFGLELKKKAKKKKALQVTPKRKRVDSEAKTNGASDDVFINKDSSDDAKRGKTIEVN